MRLIRGFVYWLGFRPEPGSIFYSPLRGWMIDNWELIPDSERYAMRAAAKAIYAARSNGMSVNDIRRGLNMPPAPDICVEAKDLFTARLEQTINEIDERMKDYVKTDAERIVDIYRKHPEICGATAPSVIFGVESEHEHVCGEAPHPEKTRGHLKHQCQLCSTGWTELPENLGIIQRQPVNRDPHNPRTCPKCVEIRSQFG